MHLENIDLYCLVFWFFDSLRYVIRHMKILTAMSRNFALSQEA